MFPLAHLGLTSLLARDDGNILLLLIGALLPDLIDKPLGHILLPENNGRIVAHTLLFAAALLISGFFWRGGLFLSLGVSTHQLLDSMYLSPDSCLWPLMGPFPATDFQVSNWLNSLADPFIVVTELIGLTALLWVLARRKRSGKKAC